jgi:predicted DNA-binding transcriptional regulator AlpA
MSDATKNLRPLLVRPKDIEAVTGIHVRTAYRMARSGAFPAPVKLNANSVAWRMNDLEAWVALRPPSDLPGPKGRT